MRKAMLLLAVTGWASAVWAAGPFDGTWKMDQSKAQMDKKPYVMELQNGTYQESSSMPKINVKADSTDQAVQGSRVFDTLAVKVVDSKAVEMTSKKDGKIVRSGKYTVSADGKTLNFEGTIYSTNQPATFKATEVRVAAGPAGSHAISGSWRVEKVSGPENTVTYKTSTDGLTMSRPDGGFYDAKFDGKDYPVKGNPDLTTVSLTKVSDHSFVETSKRDAKIVSVVHWTVSADGKTITEKLENKETGRTNTYIRIKL